MLLLLFVFTINFTFFLESKTTHNLRVLFIVVVICCCFQLLLLLLEFIIIISTCCSVLLARVCLFCCNYVLVVKHYLFSNCCIFARFLAVAEVFLVYSFSFFCFCISFVLCNINWFLDCKFLHTVHFARFCRGVAQTNFVLTQNLRKRKKYFI